MNFDNIESTGFDNHRCWSKKLSKNKAVEVEYYEKDGDNKNSIRRIRSWNFEIKRRKKIDHAGIVFTLESSDRVFKVSFYDVRHWNREEERWMHKGEDWEKYFRQRAEKESLDDALTLLNNWIASNNLVCVLEEKYGTSDIKDVVSDMERANKLEGALDVFYMLFHRYVKD